MQEKLKKLIEELGVSQQAIATGMGVGKSTVNQWYKGVRNPSGENQQKFMKWLSEYKEAIAKI